PRGRVSSRARRGGMGALLLLLCTVQFLDVLDASILNVALPSIERDLSFTQQSLQWVVSGYVLTYGGFLLLGGRLADLLGRRRVLVAGLALFGVASLAGGSAQSAGMLVATRLVQGMGAALMSPAALSLLTTSFAEGKERNKALGVWGAISGLGAAAGVIFGGLLTTGPGWRWVLYVNLPVVAAAITAAYLMIDDDKRRAARGTFDALGAVLVTAGMLSLVYGIIQAPDRGWTSARTVAALAAGVILLAGFVFNETRHPHPLAPLSILRVRGLAAANLTQLMALAGFFAMFFFVTLYMQQVVGWSALRSGLAYLPVTFGIGLSAGVSSQLFPRTGTKPVVVVGAVLGAVGMWWLSRIPASPSYVGHLLPGLVLMALGLGGVFVGITTAANAGVPSERAGLAAGLLSTSQQLGGALGLAVLSAVATGHTQHLAREGVARQLAFSGGLSRALLVGSVFLLAAAVLAVRSPNSHATATPGGGHGADSVPTQPGELVSS
ncbi:MAG: transporter, partial [Frankiales bacterium]|nr:transporter [Frankiales bacterium]